MVIRRGSMQMEHYSLDEVNLYMAGEEVRVRECHTMTPLPTRTAGGFMSPLKGCQGR